MLTLLPLLGLPAMALLCFAVTRICDAVGRARRRGASDQAIEVLQLETPQDRCNPARPPLAARHRAGVGRHADAQGSHGHASSFRQG